MSRIRSVEWSQLQSSLEYAVFHTHDQIAAEQQLQDDERAAAENANDSDEEDKSTQPNAADNTQDSFMDF